MVAKKKAKSRVNEAGNYTKPTMRKRLFAKIKAGSKGGKADSGVDAEMLASNIRQQVEDIDNGISQVSEIAQAMD